MRGFLTSILELVGLALIVAAAWVVAVPLGLFVAGVVCVLVGFLVSDGVGR